MRHIDAIDFVMGSGIMVILLVAVMVFYADCFTGRPHDADEREAPHDCPRG